MQTGHVRDPRRHVLPASAEEMNPRTVDFGIVFREHSREVLRDFSAVVLGVCVLCPLQGPHLFVTFQSTLTAQEHHKEREHQPGQRIVRQTTQPLKIKMFAVRCTLHPLTLRIESLDETAIPSHASQFALILGQNDGLDAIERTAAARAFGTRFARQ